MSSIELARRAERQLMEGDTSAEELYKQYSAISEHREFFRELAKVLSAPFMVFSNLLSVADQECHISDLVEGLANNPHVRRFQNTNSIIHMFDSSNNENTALQKAIEMGKQRILKMVEKPVVPDNSFNSQRFNIQVQEACLPKEMISWELFTSLVYSGMGLRHVSTMEQAAKEKEAGVYGDAISLSSGITHLVNHLETEGLLTQFSKEHLRPKELFERLKTEISDQEKKAILFAFETSLRQFIYRSVFCMDNTVDPRVVGWKAAWERKLPESSTFLICLKHPDQIPYDQQKYFWLGKYGRNSIDAEDFKEVIPPPSLSDIDRYQEGIEDITDQILAVHKNTIDHYIKQLMMKISKLISEAAEKIGSSSS